MFKKIVSAIAAIHTQEDANIVQTRRMSHKVGHKPPNKASPF